MKHVLRCLAFAMLAVQSGIDRFFGFPLFLALGADAPVTAADVKPDAAAPVATARATPAPASEKPATPGFKASILGALQSMRGAAAVGADLTAARGQVSTLTQERDDARSALGAEQGFSEAFIEFFGLTRAELKGKSKADLTALLKQKISDATIEQVASLGLKPAELPANKGGGNSGGDALEDIQAQMVTCKDPAQLGKLAARANAIRDGKTGEQKKEPALFGAN